MIKNAKVPGHLLSSNLSIWQFSKMLTLPPHVFPLEITATVKIGRKMIGGVVCGLDMECKL